MLDNDQSTGDIVANTSGIEPLMLDELSIPGATGPVPSGEWGINVAAGRDNFPEKGLQLYLPPWPAMGRGDAVRILLGDDEVDRKTIPQELVDQRQTMFVPSVQLRNGSNTLTYKVKRLGQVEEPAALTDIYVKLDRPGGQDQNGGQPGHSELQFSLPDDVVRDGVDKERAATGVEVTIEPYPFMAEHDRIRVTWGGQFVHHTVTLAEVGTQVVMLVEEATILAAGDSDDAGLAVAFEVIDLVDNRSEDWSAEQRVVVDTGNARLMAGIVKEAKNNVLDLEVLGNADVTFQVVAVGAPFAVGDSIVVNLQGETEDNRKVDITYPAKLIESVPAVLEIPVANADVRQLAKTQARFSYELNKSVAARQAMSAGDYQRELAEGMYKSRGQFVSIVGEAASLAAPVALDAEQGALDPDLPLTTVEVPWDDTMEAGDVITLVWEGEQPDFTPYYPEIPPHDISNGEAGRKQAFPLTVEGKHLKAIEGGKLTLLYTLERDGQSPRRSERSITLVVGEPKAELPAPSVLHAEDGVLDPDKVPAAGTSLVVKSYARIAVGDTLFFSWIGKDEEASLEDSIKISNSNIGRQQFQLTVSKALVSANDGHQVVASYRVQRVGGETSYSDELPLQVGAPAIALPLPLIEEASEEGVIDPEQVEQGATVFIGASAGLKERDTVRIEVSGKQHDAQTHAVTADGEQRFKIDYAVIVGNENSEIGVSYVVLRGGALPEEPSSSVQFTVLELATPPLPAPVILEASEEGVIDPEQVEQGATVFIGASAGLKERDTVRVEVSGKQSDAKTHTVTADGEQRFKIDYAVIKGNEDDSIGVTYFVLRGGNPPEERSGTVEYDVRLIKGKGRLHIFGARHTRSTPRASSTSLYIRAFLANTGNPVVAEWRYAGDQAWSSGREWRDSEPHRPLQVRTEDDLVVLNPANVIGNGIDGASPAGTGAFIALRNDGRVRGWGNTANGGNIPSVIRTLNDVVEVSCTTTAYAVRRVDGSVMVWGNSSYGGNMGNVSPFGFREIRGNRNAFVGIKGAGSVVAWGGSQYGGAIPPEIAALTDIVRVFAGGSAFVALRKTGQVVGWGDAAAGGTVPENILSLRDVEDVMGSSTAFAGRRANGTLVAWGAAAAGGDASAVADYIDIARLCCANNSAFVAQRETGHLVAWGAAAAGGDLPNDIKALADIVDVVSTKTAFAAVRRNGTVVAWGASPAGMPPDEISDLTNVVQVAGSAYAFAVLSHDGTVKAWGNPTFGGKTAPVASELVDVQALYANVGGFVALRRDGKVISWGDPAGGGNNAAVRDQLDNFVTYRATGASRGRALVAQQQAFINAMK